MTVEDVIKMAEAWQEDASHSGTRDDVERAATQFSYALLLLRLERTAALETLARNGFSAGPLNQRVNDAVAAATGRRS